MTIPSSRQNGSSPVVSQPLALPTRASTNPPQPDPPANSLTRYSREAGANLLRSSEKLNRAVGREFIPGKRRRPPLRAGFTIALQLLVASLLCATRLHAQDDPLNTVHDPPPSTATPNPTEPKDAEAPAATGPDALKIHPGSRIRLNVNMVLVPVTITDPMNRLVTGLEQEDFQVFENNSGQKIVSFASEDAPVSIGIIFDLSGSMSSKLIRARESILQFIKTANPQDEFFVIGFNDRPELIEDFTNSVEYIEARLATVRSGRRTALLDAIYYGMVKMKEARHERKALLGVSDGGDNRPRTTVARRA